jgi:orotate phosphoribosyltransferase
MQKGTTMEGDARGQGSLLYPDLSETRVRASGDRIIDRLLEVGAADLRPRAFFVFPRWTTPIYCDMRLALGSHAARSTIVEALAEAVRSRFPLEAAAPKNGPGGRTVQRPLTVVGVATGSIAYAALVADRLGLPTAYVRASAKDHGTGRQVEGGLEPGAPCVIVEDVLATGASSRAALDALRRHGAVVLGVCVVFSYDYASTRAAVAASGVPFVRLVTYEDVVARARAVGRIDAEEAAIMTEWYAPLARAPS